MRRLRERCAAGCFAAVFFPACAALSRATVHNRLRIGSPDRRNARLRGRCDAGCLAAVFFRLALRLAGLQVHNRLRIGSGQAQCAASEKVRCRCLAAVFFRAAP